MIEGTQLEALIVFLRSRLDDEETVARSVKPIGSTYDVGGNKLRERMVVQRAVPAFDGRYSRVDDKEAQLHIALHSPKKVLARTEAIHAVINDCLRWLELDKVGRALAHQVLWDLAQPYKTHADFEESWRP